jgi:proline-specific peptidase
MTHVAASAPLFAAVRGMDAAAFLRAGSAGHRRRWLPADPPPREVDLLSVIRKGQDAEPVGAVSHTGSRDGRLREGFIPFRGFATWYRDVGAQSPGRLPLLCVHGGPGSTHNYFEPLEELASDGRRLVFYDQLGCGESDRPDDPALWSVETFVDELRTVREALALERFHLLGTSWGGMLALEYALERPSGLASLVLNSTPPSMALWCRETARLRDALPEDIRKVLDEHERAGTTDAPAYEAACIEFYKRHFYRGETLPDCIARGLAKRGSVVYRTLNGPSEFFVTGPLRNWDISARLSELELPTLITSGRHDECTPAVARALHRAIRGSKWVLFESSAHVPFVEEAERYRAVVSEFLAEIEGRGSRPSARPKSQRGPSR